MGDGSGHLEQQSPEPCCTLEETTIEQFYGHAFAFGLSLPAMARGAAGNI